MQQGIPGIYLLLLCDVMTQLGFDEQKIIGDLGVKHDDLLKPDHRISMEIGHVAAQRGTAMAADLGLGLAYAQALRVTLHGSVGLVALTSPTIGSALQAMARFVALRAPFFQAQLQTEQDHIVMGLEPTMNMDGPIERFLTEAILIGAAIVVEQLSGRVIEGGWVELKGPEPDYYDRYRDRLPLPLRYQADGCRVRLPIYLQNAVPQLADPAAMELARKQCEKEYQDLFPDEEKFYEKIVRHLSLSAVGAPLPSQQDVARRFNMSVRTLKRRLQQEQVEFRELVEQELKSRAQILLQQNSLDISAIAYQLGYSDVANFSTAFKRWCGVTPTEFRKSLQHN